MSLPPVPSIASLRHLSVPEIKKRLLDACPEEWKDDFSFLLESAEIHTNDFWLNSCVFELKRIRQQAESAEMLRSLQNSIHEISSNRAIDWGSEESEQYAHPLDGMYCRISDDHAACIRDAANFASVSRGDCNYLSECMKKAKPSLFLAILILILRITMGIARSSTESRNRLAELGSHRYVGKLDGIIYHWTGNNHPLSEGAKGQWKKGVPPNIRFLTFIA